MKANEITGNVFDRIGKQWMLVGAMKDGKSNAMTASWGGMGVMWGKNVVFVFVYIEERSLFAKSNFVNKI